MTTGEPENQRTTIARIVNAVTFTCQVNQSQHGLAMSMSKNLKKDPEPGLQASGRTNLGPVNSLRNYKGRKGYFIEILLHFIRN